MERPLVLHDADCGFCAWCARLVPRLGARVTVSSLQAENLASLGVDPGRAASEMPVVLPGGAVVWGHVAWAEILKSCPLPLRWVGSALGSRLLERPASALYRWVAGHRHRLPGSDGTCATSPPDRAL